MILRVLSYDNAIRLYSFIWSFINLFFIHSFIYLFFIDFSLISPWNYLFIWWIYLMKDLFIYYFFIYLLVKYSPFEKRSLLSIFLSLKLFFIHSFNLTSFLVFRLRNRAVDYCCDDVWLYHFVVKVYYITLLMVMMMLVVKEMKRLMGDTDWQFVNPKLVELFLSLIKSDHVKYCWQPFDFLQKVDLLFVGLYIGIKL